MPADHAQILAEVAEMLRSILGNTGVDGEIMMETSFQEDLEMDSIDLASLAGRLEVRYGNVVNFAQFIAGLDLETIGQLRVGQLVEHVAGALDHAGVAATSSAVSGEVTA